MRKLYFITAQFTSIKAELALKELLKNYTSHFVLTPHCWLVAAGGTPVSICAELQSKTGGEATILVSSINAAIAWSKNSTDLANWLPRQLAATTNP